MTDVDAPAALPLTENAHAAVCIVGAGISGLSAAYFLAREGKSVIVLDDGPVGGGETGRSRGYLTYALDDRYAHLEVLHGERGARLAAESHRAALERVEAIVREERIDCDFELVDGYLLPAPGHSLEMLEDELRAAQRAGLTDVRMVEKSPLPKAEAARCLLFPKQAQLHPLKYLAGLAKAITRDGGRIFTAAHVVKIEGHAPVRVTVKNGPVVTAASVIVATHTPINDRYSMHTKQAPFRTYMIGALVAKGSVKRSIFFDTADPYHYGRVAGHSAAHDILIVGGEGHRTGQAHDTEARFDVLEDWARQHFPQIEHVQYRWSAQVQEPVDGLAYIGENPHDDPHVLIATGDSGNELTHGVIAGMLLGDIVQGRENEWAKLYNPKRRNLRAAAAYARSNFNVAAQYLGFLTPGGVRSVDQIPAGQGAVIRRGVQKIAVYRTPGGELHEFSAICPHLGCVVDWNATEQSWDCPCHGSRFDATGKVIHGPANIDLEPAQEPEVLEAAARE